MVLRWFCDGFAMVVTSGGLMGSGVVFRNVEEAMESSD
jgi:hypothetical protein